MQPITYARVTDPATAVAAVSADPTSDFLAGGTTEIDLLRQNVLHPRRLVDINHLPLTAIEPTREGGLRIGALARMSEVAASPMVRERCPVIRQALELGASAQLRHMASMGGNLLQRVRCSNFRDARSPCNKRDPGTGCSALDGFSRGHAVLGTSGHCIAAHPSDVAVALMAMDARVHTLAPGGERTCAFELVRRAVADAGSPLPGADPLHVVVRDGVMTAGTASESYADLLQRTFQPDAEALGVWSPPGRDAGFATMTFGAQFAEVAVDPELGLVRVRRMTGAFAPGRVLNPKTARSELTGGMLWGLGQALLEANHMHPRTGRWANASLGEYLVAVNADAPDIDVELVEVDDSVVNPLGVKGVGEIGQVGAAAAIANAVHHATGRRVRRFPITVEDLL